MGDPKPTLNLHQIVSFSSFSIHPFLIFFPFPLYLCRLEQDVKKLKADLQASRQVEQDLRSQIGSLGSAERSIRSELGQLRQENELLQNK